jgi:hypothetical protein
MNTSPSILAENQMDGSLGTSLKKIHHMKNKIIEVFSRIIIL